MNPYQKLIELRAVEGHVEARALAVQLPDGITRRGARVLASTPSPSDFEARVLGTRVDLVAIIREGLPPVEYLPASDGMLVKGKRHLIAAPRKEGKSIAMLAHWVRMVLAGARVIVLDRENGARLYAERLAQICAAWSVSKQLPLVRKKLEYYEFPKFRAGDGELFARTAAGADVVVFDAQRMFLTDFGLAEGDSDDYSTFMAELVEPLFGAEVATVILDNTGHDDKTRSRGSSAKGDLNEVLFTLKADEKFSRRRKGRLRLILEPGNSRFGNDGEWEMRIGGGAFSPWQRLGEAAPDDPEFRRAAVEALRAAGNAGLNQTKLLDAIRAKGVKFKNDPARQWLLDYDENGAVPIAMFAAEKPGLPTMFFFSGAVK